MASTYYSGAYFTIHQSDDFANSLADLISVHRKNSDAHLARGDTLIKTLADTGRLRSPDQFRQETQGFWAIRAGNIRFYGWYEPNGIFVLSHVIFKSTEKLSKADIARMNTNQTDYRNKGKKK